MLRRANQRNSASQTKFQKSNRLQPNFISKDPLLQTGLYIHPSPFFIKTLSHPAVRKVVDFWEKWNDKVLWLLNDRAWPYREDMQQKLADFVAPYVPKEAFIADIGTGSGGFISRLVHKTVDRIIGIFAVDLDLHALTAVPDSLRAAGFVSENQIGFQRKKLWLIQASTMHPLHVDLIRPESMDLVTSVFGGIMYAGWFFNSGMPLEKRAALQACLKSIHAILKPNGYLAMSVPKPGANWTKIVLVSLWWYLRRGRLFSFFKFLPYAIRAKIISSFMHELVSSGHAHYLTKKEWCDQLEQVGFEVVEFFEEACFSRQAHYFIARKL